MKNNQGASILLLALIVVLSSCANVIGGKMAKASDAAEGKASIKLSFHLPAAKTIAPDKIDLDAAIIAYAVRLSCPGYADVTATADARHDAQPSRVAQPAWCELTIPNLALAYWVATVQALNAAGEVVATGSGEVDLSGEDPSSEYSIGLEYDMTKGYGDIELSILFPKNLVDAAVVTLKSGTTMAIPVVIGRRGGQG